MPQPSLASSSYNNNYYSRPFSSPKRPKTAAARVTVVLPQAFDAGAAAVISSSTPPPSALGVARALTAPTLPAACRRIPAPAEERRVTGTGVMPRGRCSFPPAPDWAYGAALMNVTEYINAAAVAMPVCNQQSVSLSTGTSPKGLLAVPLVNKVTSSDGLTLQSKEADSARVSLSRRGLSVHAAPFQPRSSTADLCALNSTLETAEMRDSFGFREGQQLKASSSRSANLSTGPALSLTQTQGIWTPRLEFPRTPIVNDGGCVRLSTSAGTANSVIAVRPQSSASFRGGESLQWSTSLLPVSPIFASQQQSQSQQFQDHIQQQRHTFGGSNSSGSVVYPPDIKDDSGSCNVRHRRVPFTDAEAKDEAAMLRKLHSSSSSCHIYDDDDDDDDDEEYETLYSAQQQQQQQQQNMIDNANVLPNNFDVKKYAGGFWDEEGPRAATRRFLRRGTSSTASLTLTAVGSRGSPACVYGNSGVTDRIGGFCGSDKEEEEEEEELWEMNSSAYADSLDEAQIEWIEQQLHAKENPDGFFF